MITTIKMIIMTIIPDDILYPSKRMKCSLLLSLKSNELLRMSPDNRISSTSWLSDLYSLFNIDANVAKRPFVLPLAFPLVLVLV